MAKKAADLREASGDLRIVQAFVNTADRWTETDGLASLQGLADWLVRWRLATPGLEPAEADLERAVAIRQSLRFLLAVHGNGRQVDEQAAARLDALASDASFRLRFDRDGTTRFETSSDGLAGIFGRLWETVAHARQDDRWPRLKICASEACRRVFFDASNSATGRWCSMRCCNRTHGRRLRRRQKASPFHP